MVNELPLLREWFGQFQQALSQFKANLPISFLLIAVLVFVHILNAMLGYRLNYLGLRPRRIDSLLGIPLMVVLHGDFNHLFFNLIPFFVLVNMLLLKGVPAFVTTSFWLMGLTGLGLWLVGRKAIHIGSSALNFAYLGCLAMNAYLHPSFIGGIIFCILLYYFAGMLFGIIPSEEGVSWEGHLVGLLTGIGFAYWS